MRLLVLFLCCIGSLGARTLSISDLVNERYTKQELQDDEVFHYLGKPKINLISFASSGNTWTRYSLEYLTKHPSFWHFRRGDFENKTIEERVGNAPTPRRRDHGRLGFMNPPFGTLYPDMEVDLSKPPIIKRHKPWIVNNSSGSMVLMRKTDKVILLLRNPKEIYFRRREKNYHTEAVKLLEEYFKLIELYDAWNPDLRLLVHYEDLVEKPRETFQRMLDFMGCSNEHLDSFLENKEFHKERCMVVYSSVRGKSLSMGNEAIFYTNNVSPNILKRIDNEIKAARPTLFNKYLKRYETK